MTTPNQYRAHADKYSELIKGTDKPDEIREFKRLEHSFTELAENDDWMANNSNKTVQREDATSTGTLTEEEGPTRTLTEEEGRTGALSDLHQQLRPFHSDMGRPSVDPSRGPPRTEPKTARPLQRFLICFVSFGLSLSRCSLVALIARTPARAARSHRAQRQSVSVCGGLARPGRWQKD